MENPYTLMLMENPIVIISVDKFPHNTKTLIHYKSLHYMDTPQLSGMEILAIILSVLLLAWMLWAIGHPTTYRHIMFGKPKRKIKFFFFDNDLLTTKIGGFQMEKSVQALAGLLIYGHIEPKDNTGNDVKIGGDIFSSSDESILTVIANPKNPLYFIGTLTGAVGDVKVQVSIDPDGNSTEDTPVTDFATLHVTPDLATSANLTFDDADDAPDTTGTQATV